MKRFHSHIDVNAHPDLRLRLHVPRIAFDVTTEGSAEIDAGPVEIEIGAIPVMLRVPFHHRRLAAATIGPFSARIKPTQARFRSVGLRGAGAIGAGGIAAEAAVTGDCRAELAVSGEDAEDPC